ncbi:MAG: Gfo/Idh/MocA family oxidoreductase [Chloroflexota bacterium]
MSNYKILISGCGGAGRNVAKVAAADGRGEIVGLVDPQQAQLERMQALYPGAITGDNYAMLLRETQPDVVVVAGPDHLHADQTVLALEQGCHALVEKPLATTTADAQRILDAEAQSGLHVMTDQTMRYMHPWHEMALMAKAGDIGDVFFVQGDYIHDMWSHYAPEGKHHTPWRIDQGNPQNILLGGGCHPLDLMLWTVDSPVAEVYAYSNKLSIPVFPADDCYIVILQFENGVTGKVYVTSGCSGHGMADGMGGGFLAVYGTEGTLWKGQLYRRDYEPVPIDEADAHEVIGGHGWGRSVVDFLDVLDGKIDNPLPGKIGAQIVSVCDAALESIRTKRPQSPRWF